MHEIKSIQQIKEGQINLLTVWDEEVKLDIGNATKIGFCKKITFLCKNPFQVRGYYWVLARYCQCSTVCTGHGTATVE